ncbi:S-layer homology domain-containing protein [Pseudoclostridium thermosuccinogenes]|uniref:S-layer homology domain-containing protein n=1 Tax=Clostridium thermosuccinogenes TaxID=84032 RepID=UPI002FD9273B
MGCNVYAQDEPSFAFDKSTIKVNRGEEFTLIIKAKSLKNMYGFEVALTYDKDKLELINASSDLRGYSFYKESENKLYYAFTNIGEDEKTESGDMNICKLTFGDIKEDTGITLEEVTVVEKNTDGELTKTSYIIGETAEVSVIFPKDPSPAPSPPPNPTSGTTSGLTSDITVTSNGNTIIVSAFLQTTTNALTGEISATVSISTVTGLIDRIKAAETDEEKMLIVLNMNVKENAKAVVLKIPQSAFRQIAESTNAGIKVDAGIGTIIFDSKAVDAINNSASDEDIIIRIEMVDKDSLDEEVQKKIGDRPVYNFTVNVGNREVSDFENGKAEIIVPYILRDGEEENCIVICYIDDTGELHILQGRYDSESRTVKFITTHFSLYAIIYNKVNFIDVEVDDWYYDAVEFLAARNIVKGVGYGKFAPADNIKRADFLVMVMNAYGIKLDTDIADNFSDAGNKYYTRYLGTAKRLGIVQGVGDNKFAPEEYISRQDMFVLLYRLLDKLDELPSEAVGKQLENFADADDIAGYAREAMKLFVETGIASGDGEYLAPKSLSTRAQAAKTLYNLLSKKYE